MSRAPCSFKQTDIARAVRAATAAGIEVRGIEIHPATGNFTIVTNKSSASEYCTDLDRWIADHARSS